MQGRNTWLHLEQTPTSLGASHTRWRRPATACAPRACPGIREVTGACEDLHTAPCLLVFVCHPLKGRYMSRSRDAFMYAGVGGSTMSSKPR